MDFLEGYLWDFSIIYIGINKLSHNDIQKLYLVATI